MSKDVLKPLYTKASNKKGACYPVKEQRQHQGHHDRAGERSCHEERRRGELRFILV